MHNVVEFCDAMHTSDLHQFHDVINGYIPPMTVVPALALIDPNSSVVLATLLTSAVALCVSGVPMGW